MAALWSILLVDIKTVIHIIATRTINAFGGLVMFILGTLVFRAGQGMVLTVHKGCRIARKKRVTGFRTYIRQCCSVCKLQFCKLP